MKVTGIQRTDGDKDYYITHDGVSYTATKVGNQFECNGVTSTLRDIKSRIVAGTLEGVDLGSNDEVVALQLVSNDTWSCVHPCALIALFMSLDDEVKRTLDAWGWLDENGEVDIERAHREWTRFSSKQTDS